MKIVIFLLSLITFVECSNITTFWIDDIGNVKIWHITNCYSIWNAPSKYYYGFTHSECWPLNIEEPYPPYEEKDFFELRKFADTLGYYDRKYSEGQRLYPIDNHKTRHEDIFKVTKYPHYYNFTT